MRNAILLGAAMLLGCLAVSATAAELPPEFADGETAEIKAAEGWAGVPSLFTDADYVKLEKRVANLETTRITAAEARTIAKEEIAKVTVALQEASGKIQTQRVAVQANGQGSFVIPAGGKLLGYTDPMTGRYIDLTNQPVVQQTHRSYSQPVHYYDSPGGQFAVPQQGNSQRGRGWFRASPRTMQHFSSCGPAACN